MLWGREKQRSGFYLVFWMIEIFKGPMIKEKSPTSLFFDGTILESTISENHAFSTKNLSSFGFGVPQETKFLPFQTKKL